MSKKKLKLMKRSGKVVDLPKATIKKVLSNSGFTGRLLLNAVGGVFREASHLARSGIITATNLEKAIVKAVSNTNRLAINTAQRVTKKMVK